MKSFPRYAVVYHNCKDSSNRAIIFNKFPSLSTMWHCALSFEDVFCIVDNRITHLIKTCEGVFQLQVIRPDEILSLFSAKMTSISRLKL